MYKKILVPLDTSKQAEMILPHVEELAKKMESEVLFLVILEPGEQKPSTHEAQFYIDAFDRDMKEAKDYLEFVAVGHEDADIRNLAREALQRMQRKFEGKKKRP